MSSRTARRTNVQLVGARPTFIDIGSFEQSTGPWPGYGSSVRRCCSRCSSRPTSACRTSRCAGAIDGLSATDVAGMSRATAGSAGRLRNVHAAQPARAQGHHGVRDGQVDLKSSGSDRAGQGHHQEPAQLVRGLEVAKRARLRRRALGLVRYRGTCSYSDDDARAKQAFVSAALAEGPSSVVLDLGANDGEYSALAAEHADYVVRSTATRRGRPALTAAARRRQGEHPPAVMNLVDPSGHRRRNRERAPFVERVRPDATMALALIPIT